MQANLIECFEVVRVWLFVLFVRGFLRLKRGEMELKV